MDQCVPWTGKVDKGHYGRVRWGGVWALAHRKAYCDHHNLTAEDIAGKGVMHTCDNPTCVNPLHLTIGTQADNMRDMAAKGRHVGFRILTAEQAKCIREEYVPRSRECSQYALARKYRVSRSAINNILRGDNWK